VGDAIVVASVLDVAGIEGVVADQPPGFAATIETGGIVAEKVVVGREGVIAGGPENAVFVEVVGQAEDEWRGGPEPGVAVAEGAVADFQGAVGPGGVFGEDVEAAGVRGAGEFGEAEAARGGDAVGTVRVDGGRGGYAELERLLLNGAVIHKSVLGQRGAFAVNLDAVAQEQADIAVSADDRAPRMVSLATLVEQLVTAQA